MAERVALSLDKACLGTEGIRVMRVVSTPRMDERTDFGIFGVKLTNVVLNAESLAAEEARFRVMEQSHAEQTLPILAPV